LSTPALIVAISSWEPTDVGLAFGTGVSGTGVLTTGMAGISVPVGIGVFVGSGPTLVGVFPGVAVTTMNTGVCGGGAVRSEHPARVNPTMISRAKLTILSSFLFSIYLASLLMKMKG